jgi:hypothetical protein
MEPSKILHAPPKNEIRWLRYSGILRTTTEKKALFFSLVVATISYKFKKLILYPSLRPHNIITPSNRPSPLDFARYLKAIYFIKNGRVYKKGHP